MASAAAFNRNSLYCYVLLIAVLLFQLRYLPPAWEHELLSAHTRTVFFIVAALLARGAAPQKIYPAWLLGLCGGFFVIALLATFNAVEPGAAFARWYNYFSCWLLAWGVCIALSSGLLTVSGIFSALLGCCLAIVLAEARDLAQEWELYRNMNRNFLWNPLYFNQLRNFAHVPFAGLVVSVWLLCKPVGEWRFYSGLLLTTVFMTVLLWSGGRTPLIMLVLSLVGFLVLLPAPLFRRVALAWIASIVVGLGFLQLTDNDFMLHKALGRFDQDLGRIAGAFSGGGAEETSAGAQDLEHLGSGRMTHWRTAYSLWQENPLLGRGADAFLVETRFVTTHPHNWVLRTLLEFGVVGLGLAVAILAAVLWSALRLIHALPAQSAELTVATVLLVAWLAYGILSGTLYFSWSLALFSIAAGIVVSATSALQGRATAAGIPGGMVVSESTP